MPVVHRGAKPRGQHCQGPPLDKCHDELACHAQGEKRNDIIRLLNCWIDTIEGECSVKKKKPQPNCMGYTLCFPQFSCEKGAIETKKLPLCVKGDAPAALIPKTSCYQEKPLWKRDGPVPMPVWERPRVKSSQLIAGDFRKVKECFRANGLNDFDYCPRTDSCELMQCLNEMIEADRRLHGPEAIAPDCCCRPGDAPSRMPQYPCMSCEPPNKYGYKDNMDCPAEIGRHGEHHKNYNHDESCQHPHHRKFSQEKHPGGERKPAQMRHSHQKYNGPNRVAACLKMDNPRSSAELWQDLEVDVFGRSNM